jgi:hypothetical protein
LLALVSRVLPLEDFLVKLVVCRCSRCSAQWLTLKSACRTQSCYILLHFCCVVPQYITVAIDPPLAAAGLSIGHRGLTLLPAVFEAFRGFLGAVFGSSARPCLGLWARLVRVGVRSLPCSCSGASFGLRCRRRGAVLEPCWLEGLCLLAVVLVHAEGHP